MREQDRVLAWGSLVVVLIALFCAVILDPIHKQNVEKIGKNLYKFQDTLEFVDKDTDKVIKRSQKRHSS